MTRRIASTGPCMAAALVAATIHPNAATDVVTVRIQRAMLDCAGDGANHSGRGAERWPTVTLSASRWTAIDCFAPAC